MSLMTMSNRSRRGEQNGQMLVSVIVLLTLMFFIGSAMALAVSSSLHTIAQTNSMDSVSYAAESAVAKGLANAVQPVFPRPQIGHGGTGGNATWSYTYELVAGGVLSGWSGQGSDFNSSSTLDATNTETITIPDQFGNASFELYRTGANPSDTGYVGIFALAAGGSRDITDTGLKVIPPPPLCTGLSSLGQVNNHLLTATTCRVPVDTDHSTLQMWSAPGQIVPARPRPCATQPLAGSFAPGTDPGTIWGVVGWHAVSKKSPPKLTVSVGNKCNAADPRCFTSGATSPGLLYFWCELKAGDVVKALQLVNTGGDATVSAFVVRGAPSGPDCVVTSMGQASPVSDEADHRLDLCNWDSATQTLWNRVLP